MKTAFFERDSVRLAYDDLGRGDPPLIFLHGLGGDRNSFAPQVARFGETHRILLVDLRGHGESSVVPFSVAECAKDIVGLCDACGLDKPIVIGFSLGGIVAVDIAARFGDRLSGAVLIDPPILVSHEKLPSMADVVAGIYSGRAVESWAGFVERMFPPFDDQMVKQRVIEQILRTSGETIQTGFSSSGRFEAEKALEQCKIPLLFISAGLPSDPAAALAHCPHVWWGKTVGAGHFAHLTAPEQVNAMVARFLEFLGRQEKPLPA